MQSDDKGATQVDDIKPEIRAFLTANARQKAKFGRQLIFAGLSFAGLAAVIWWQTEEMRHGGGTAAVLIYALITGLAATGVLKTIGGIVLIWNGRRALHDLQSSFGANTNDEPIDANDPVDGWR